MTVDRETRQRLLDAASRLFAERGFKDVTVRDICRAARANVSAVNYHFGDKRGLYVELLHAATALIRETTQEAKHAGEGRPADARLRVFIQVHLQSLLAPGRDTVQRMVQREMQEPTPALDALIEEGLRPRIEYLSTIVAEVMGTPVDDPRVLRCVASIQSQTLMYRPNPIAARLGFVFEPTPAHIEAAARHIAEFSIAGVRAIGKSPSGAATNGARTHRATPRLASRRSG
jgi:AcrR family transcriptional regulator